MSHGTGILPNEELAKTLSEAKTPSNPYRVVLIRVDVPKCQLYRAATYPKSLGGITWQQDYENFLKSGLIPKDGPSYMLIDMADDGDNDWMLLYYSPSSSKLKEKMIMASTKATFKHFFGSSLINFDVYADEWSGLELDRIEQQMEEKTQTRERKEDDWAARTVEETERYNARKAEIASKFEARRTVQCAFSCADDVHEQIESFRDGRYVYLKFIIDMQSTPEKIVVSDRRTASEFPALNQTYSSEDPPERLAQILIPSGSSGPGFHLVSFRHVNPEVNAEDRKTIFVALMPFDGMKIKERVTYAASQKSLNEIINSVTVISKRMEADQPDAVTAQAFFELLYPSLYRKGTGTGDGDSQQETSTGVTELKFSKPTGPGGRGPRRIIK